MHLNMNNPDHAEYDIQTIIGIHDFVFTRKADIKEWLKDSSNETYLMHQWTKWLHYMSNIPMDLHILKEPGDEKIQMEVKIKMYRSMKYLWEIINKLQTTYPKLIEN